MVSHLPLMSVNQAYLHTVHCSPSKSGFHTGAHTRHKGHVPRSNAPPVVLPLASYTPYSERARGPHKCGRRHGRLQIGKTGRKQLKDQVWLSITVGPSRGPKHLESSGGRSLQKRILLGSTRSTELGRLLARGNVRRGK